ncbi:PcfB family protein [Turicibacter sanguinis]|nr:PcfB family protein [Turicibacter sanguinis]
MDQASQEVVRCTFVAEDISRKLLISMLKLVQEKLSNGEQSLRTLNKKNTQLEVIDVSNEDIKGIKRGLKKHGVNFAVVKESQENNYSIYFQAKDVAQIKKAIEVHMQSAIKNLEQEPLEKKLSNITIEKKSPNKTKQREELTL